MPSRSHPPTVISRRRVLALLGAAMLPIPAAASPSVISALQEGGLVVYFRHGATTWSGVDRIEWPRERQRLLSNEGIAQSEQIGAAFRAHGIPVGEVMASPFARCADMARIAFGRVDERMELIGLLSDASGRRERVSFLRRLVTEPPAQGTNRIVISHRSNIAEVAGARLAEGEAVVLRPDGAGSFTSLGTLMPHEW